MQTPVRAILIPLYNPYNPSCLIILLTQSEKPENCLWPPDTQSVDNLVLTKSRGYTKDIVQAPASPPESIEQSKNLV